MAYLNLSICDLCKGLTNGESLTFPVLIDGKEAEICKDCRDGLLTKLNEPFDLSKHLFKQNATAGDGAGDIKVLDDGIAIVQSKALNVSAPPGKSTDTCLHDKKSFELDGVTCRDCGENLKEDG